MSDRPATIYPVVLSGGSGTRLWPVSRAMYPKQFINFSESQRSSLLAETLRRLPVDQEFAAPTIVCNNDHRFLVQAECARAGVVPLGVVLEPSPRNTAPAIAAAALLIERKDAAGILVVMPSDHVIKSVPAFLAAVRQAGKIAAANSQLVLFGITPELPHTGYGYLRGGAPLEGFGGAFTIDAFVEKPDKKTAETFLAAKTYYWNSGMFVFAARTYLAELARHQPAILEAAKEAIATAEEDLGFLRLNAQAFAKAPSISIDYAVMERTKAAVVLPVDMGWSDVGSWASLWELGPRDAAGNSVRGEAILKDTGNCYVHSEKALVSTLGVKDLIIVNTPDALLVANRQNTEDVSGIVAHLKETGRNEHVQHLRSYRPWGYFETLSSGPRFQVKLLHVKPGGKLSMQMHHHRSEHWVVVHGTAKVTIGAEEQLVRENKSVYITATQWHRLENLGKTQLELIEVQIGSYLGEDDIIRSDDIYKRGPEEVGALRVHAWS